MRPSGTAIAKALNRSPQAIRSFCCRHGIRLKPARKPKHARASSCRMIYLIASASRLHSAACPRRGWRRWSCTRRCGTICLLRSSMYRSSRCRWPHPRVSCYPILWGSRTRHRRRSTRLSASPWPVRSRSLRGASVEMRRSWARRLTRSPRRRGRAATREWRDPASARSGRSSSRRRRRTDGPKRPKEARGAQRAPRTGPAGSGRMGPERRREHGSPSAQMPRTPHRSPRCCWRCRIGPASQRRERPVRPR